MSRVILVPPLIEATTIQSFRLVEQPITAEGLPSAVLYQRPHPRVVDGIMDRARHGFEIDHYDDYDFHVRSGDQLAIQKQFDEQLERAERSRVWCAEVPKIELHHLRVDPMITEVRWRCGISKGAAFTHISAYGIFMTEGVCHTRFWDRSGEIEEWVAENLSRDLLVQSTDDGWRFVALTESDASKLRRWLEQPKQNLVALPGHNERHEAIIKWATENIRGEWFDASDAPNGMGWIRQIRLMIRRDADAVLAKVRWSEEEEND